jgi:hypothetical protein
LSRKILEVRRCLQGYGAPTGDLRTWSGGHHRGVNPVQITVADANSGQSGRNAREPMGRRDNRARRCPVPVTEVFAAITVRDRDAAIEYYKRLLGAPPTMLPNDDEAAWQLTGGGWLDVLREGRDGGGQRAHDLDHRSRR